MRSMNLERPHTKPIDLDGRRQRDHDRRETFSAVVEKHLDTLYNFVRREIAYHVAIGDVLPDEMAVEDVAVAVALRALHEFADQPLALSCRAWLIGLALEQIEADVSQSMRARAHVRPGDHSASDTPPVDRVSTLGDEILEGVVSDRDVRTPQATAGHTYSRCRSGFAHHSCSQESAPRT